MNPPHRLKRPHPVSCTDAHQTRAHRPNPPGPTPTHIGIHGRLALTAESAGCGQSWSAGVAVLTVFVV